MLFYHLYFCKIYINCDERFNFGFIVFEVSGVCPSDKKYYLLENTLKRHIIQSYVFNFFLEVIICPAQ